MERKGPGARIAPLSSMMRMAISWLSWVMEKMELETSFEVSRRSRGREAARKSWVAPLVEAIFARRTVSSAEVWILLTTWLIELRT